MNFIITVLKIFLRKKWDETKKPLLVIGLIILAIAIVPVIIGGIFDLTIPFEARLYIIIELEAKGVPIITTSVIDLWTLGGFAIYSLMVFSMLLLLAVLIIYGIGKFITWIFHNLKESINEARNHEVKK